MLLLLLEITTSSICRCISNKIVIKIGQSNNSSSRQKMECFAARIAGDTSGEIKWADTSLTSEISREGGLRLGHK